MKLHKIFTPVLAALALIAGSCSDSYMEDLNTDPSKANGIDPNAQLTTAQLQTYGDLGMVEIYRNYHYAFSQMLMGCWNTTNYGGRHTIDNNEMCRIWTSLYPNAIKNLTDGIHNSEEEGLTNVNAASAHLSRLYDVPHYRCVWRCAFQRGWSRLYCREIQPSIRHSGRNLRSFLQ